MTDLRTRAEDARRESAADWVVRLGSPLSGAPELGVDEALSFDAWLDAHPGNARAYDATLAVLLELEAAAPAISARIGREAGRARVRSRRLSPRGWLAAGAAAVAATVALAVMPFGASQVASQTYMTAKGEHRTVKLADGTVIDLNGGSKLTVALGRHDRRVTLPEGEAVFDVAADKARPFLIAAGDRMVRVVGTRFDVRERSGDLSVTVERGVVEVLPAEGVAGRTWRLHPGQRLDHADGAQAVEIQAADPAQVFSWRSGRLIYRDRPLGDVIADLNAQFPTAIRLEDPALGDIRVSGVLVLDDQSAVIRRLALLAPITALPSAGEILLRRDPAAKP
jgi:transmembrane sensor